MPKVITPHLPISIYLRLDPLVDVIIGVLRQVGNKHLAGSVWRSGVLSLRGRRARRLVHEPGA